MKKETRDELRVEIKHIFDSGANEIRIENMVDNFVRRRYIEASKLFEVVDAVEARLEDEDIEGHIWWHKFRQILLMYTI